MNARANQQESPPPDTLMGWALDKAQCGILLLDQRLCIAYANPWLLNRALMSSGDLLGRPLFDAFPELGQTRFHDVLLRTQSSGFPALLSESLHPSPFPLWPPSLARQRPPERRLRQTLHIVPMAPPLATQLGQRHTLIQISDVTPATRREDLLRAQADKLHAMAYVDGLTGIGNRRQFDHMLRREWRDAARHGRRVALVLFDIDFFKQYNDQYGHQRGDECLRSVARLVESVAQRPRDVACRYGGEELALLLPDTDAEGASRLAHQVLGALRDLGIAHAGSPVGQLRLSAGVASLAPLDSEEPYELIRLADRSLYEAKQSGRDRVGPGHSAGPDAAPVG